MTIAVLATSIVAAACSTEPGAMQNTNLRTFCNAWAGATQATGPEPTSVLLNETTVGQAVDVSASGSNCNDPEATVVLDDAMVAEIVDAPEEMPEGEVDGAVLPLANVLGSPTDLFANNITALQPSSDLVGGIRLKHLTVSLSLQGIHISGVLGVELGGVESDLTFTGLLQDLNNYTLNIESDALTIPGMTVEPAQVVGTLTRTNGVATATLSFVAAEPRHRRHADHQRGGRDPSNRARRHDRPDQRHRRGGRING